jgi:hypothetical protein
MKAKNPEKAKIKPMNELFSVVSTMRMQLIILMSLR